LPRIIDDDGDPVTLSASLGAAGAFTYLTLIDPATGILNIDDISVANLNLKPGMYLMTLDIDDGKDIAKIPFALIILALPVDLTQSATNTTNTTDPIADQS
jgi:hypothetical protein